MGEGVWKEKERKASDAGSQYCCGRVGMGIQSPFTFHGSTDGWTDGRTDGQKASYKVTCLRSLSLPLIPLLRDLSKLISKPNTVPGILVIPQQ